LSTKASSHKSVKTCYHVTFASAGHRLQLMVRIHRAVLPDPEPSFSCF
jgi:hypothetical protein